MRFIWLSFGLIFVGLGGIGILLPIMPTVPFLLLATYCFAKSSPQLENWLLTHPKFGPMLNNWRETGSIHRKAKIYATLTIGASVLISLALGFSWKIIAIQAVVLACVLIFIWTRPDQ